MTFPPIAPFLPTTTGLLGLLALAAVLAGLAVLGRAAVTLPGAGRKPNPRGIDACDLFTGLGVATLVFVVFGTVFRLPLMYAFYGLMIAVALGAAMMIRRQGLGALSRIQDGEGLWRVIVLTAPLFLLIVGMTASQWDEFSHWLPNAAYLIHYDGFPASDKPPSPSGLPGYPYGTALITYMTSRLTGVFVENAVIMANLAMLVALAPLYLTCVATGLGKDAHWGRTWRTAAFGFLGVTLLSTVFIQKLVLSNYADVPTAIIFAVLGVLAWRILDRLTENGGLGEARAIALRFGLAAAFFLFVRQTNLVLFVLLMGMTFVVALRDPNVRFTRLLRLTPAMVLPGAAVWVAWTVFKATEIGGGDFSFRAVEDWNLQVIPEILQAMLGVAADKGAFFVMMTALVFFGLVWLVRPQGRLNPLFGRFALIAGGIFTGYNVFLFATYVAAFGELDALRVASYWRYNSQLGLMGAMAAAMGLAFLWRKRLDQRPRMRAAARGLGSVFIVLVLLSPVLFLEKIRFDAQPGYTYYRAVVRDLARDLPAGSTLVVLDIKGQGQAGVMAKFETMSGSGFGRGLSVGPYISSYQFKGTAASLRRQVREAGADHLLVYAPLPVVEEAFAIALTERATTLIKQTGTGWTEVRRWPYPPTFGPAHISLD